MSARAAHLRTALLPWRQLAAAAVLCVLLGLALAGRLPALVNGGGTHPGRATATRARAPGRLALASREQLSGALGASLGAYHFDASAGTLQARNSAQHLGLSARPGELVLSSARATGAGVGLHLQALGYGGSLRALAPASPAASANRVTYSHAGVSEWYLNGPLGVEQGFTLARAPAGSGQGALTLAIGLSRGAHASLDAGRASLTLTQAGERPLSYGALSASDANGRPLRAWMALRDGEVLLRLDAAGARYPLTIDPLVQQGPESPLQVSEAEGGNSGEFGFSVAISGDGKTALVGAPGANGFAGAAWVFTRSGGAWVQQGPKLTGGEPGGEAEGCSEEAGEAPGECGFGHSVALSGDGNTALIGAPRDNEQRGAAWIFTRSGSTWTMGPELFDPGEGSGGRFGRTVVLSADGQTALVGAPATGLGRGAAWVFARNGSAWASEGELSGEGAEGEAHFGFGLALSADGASALIGGPGDAGRTGAVWAFQRSGTTWAQSGSKLTGSGEIGEGRFGYSVALSSDASTALVGARSDDGDTGAVWTFADAGAGFVQQGPKLTAEAAGTGQFGYTVALSSDGATALIGEPHGGDNRGTAALLERSGAGWAQAKGWSAGAGARGSGSFGLSLALSSEGNLALVGTPTYEAKTGAVFPFGPDPTVEGLNPARGPAAGGTAVTITGANLAGASAVMFGSTPAAGFTVTSATSITATSPAGFGKVDVTVTTPFGTSATNPLDVFAYSKHLGVGGELEEVTGATSAPGTPVASGAVLAAGPLAGGGICAVSLRSRNITVRSHGRAAVKLLLKGSGRCSGRLTLRFSRRIARHRYRIRTIAARNFTITGSQAQTITLTLNARGRSLLRSGHGRLRAQLSVLRLSPVPRLAHTSSVRLAIAKRRPVKVKR